LTNIEAMALYSIQRRLRRKHYDIDAILNHSIFIIEDLAFNSILIRANQHLLAMAKTIRAEVPDDLLAAIEKTPAQLEELWDPYNRQYYSRYFITHQLLKESSIATLLPLYAGSVTKERAADLVKMLENDKLFGPAYPIPSTPLESAYFNAKRYWQGPTWVNMNWLIIDGLRRYDFHDHADALTESTLELIATSGIAEYYDPLVGEALGADDFSWTAALAIDMMQTKRD
jgi:glycogen debranching enzyme